MANGNADGRRLTLTCADVSVRRRSSVSIFIEIGAGLRKHYRRASSKAALTRAGYLIV